MAGQTFITDNVPAVSKLLDGENHFTEMMNIVDRLVKETMSEACTDEYTQETVGKKRSKNFVGDVLFFIQTPHVIITQQ
jgi:hypothetical protein